MPGRIPQTFIDDLMSRVDLVDLVDSKFPLKQSGRNYVARCPFHQEKTPSFTVNREKQLYYCFGCGAGGTAIGFLMEYDRLDFVEAVEDLARFAGLKVPRSDPVGGATTGSENLSAVYELQNQVASFYSANLYDRNIGREAVKYLRKRGLDGRTARHFLLGFAPPGWTVLRERFSSSVLNDTGLLVPKEDGRSYDRFRNRIIFPIRDRRGRVVGFGGRVLDDSLPKYLNSPETAVFQKSKLVYGLYELLAGQSRPDRILMVEGYMDVIALAQNGVRNAVATLGTAVSQNHLEILFRFTREIVFCFDGDRAGKQAAWRAVEVALPTLKEGRSLRIMLMPEEHDPDSMIRRAGRERFEQTIDESILLSEYFFDYLSDGLNLSNLEDCADLAAKARPLIARLPPGVFRDLMETRLRELVRHENVEIYDSGKPADRIGPHDLRGRERKKLSPIRIAISLVMQHTSLVQFIDSTDPRLQNASEAGIELLLKVVEIIRRQPQINLGGLLERFRGTVEEPSLRKLASMELVVPEDGVEAEFKGALARILAQEREKRIVCLLEKGDNIRLTTSEREELRLLLPTWGGVSRQ